MKLLLDIKDNKAAAFIEMIKSLSYIKAQSISAQEAEIFNEIREIKNAFKNAELIKLGKIKTHPIENLLNDL